MATAHGRGQTAGGADRPPTNQPTKLQPRHPRTPDAPSYSSMSIHLPPSQTLGKQPELHHSGGTRFVGDPPDVCPAGRWRGRAAAIFHSHNYHMVLITVCDSIAPYSATLFDRYCKKRKKSLCAVRHPLQAWASPPSKERSWPTSRAAHTSQSPAPSPSNPLHAPSRCLRTLASPPMHTLGMIRGIERA